MGCFLIILSIFSAFILFCSIFTLSTILEEANIGNYTMLYLDALSILCITINVLYYKIERVKDEYSF